MAELTPTKNAEETEIAGGQPDSGGKTNSNIIEIGVPFEIAGTSGNKIFSIQVDHGPNLTSGWKIHNGSTVQVNGKGLGIFKQIALWVGSNRELITAKDIRRISGDAGLDFTAHFGKDLYSGGAAVKLEFIVDQNRPNLDRTLGKNFYYEAEEGESQEEKGNKAQAAAESAQKQAGARSIGPAGLALDAAGAVMGGITKAVLPNSLFIEQNRKILGAALKSGDQAAIKKAIDEAARLGDSEGLKQALKLTQNSTYTQNINSAVEQISRTSQVRSAQTAGFAVRQTSQRTVSGTSENVLDSDEEVQQNVTASETVSSQRTASQSQTISAQGQSTTNSQVQAQQQTSGNISQTAERSVTGQASLQNTASANVSAGAESQVSVKASISGQAGTGAARSQVPSAAKMELVSRENLKTLGQHLANNPKIIAKANLRGEIMEALGTGQVDELNTEAKATLKLYLEDLKNGEIEAPRETIAAAGETLGQLEGRPQGQVPAGSKPLRDETPGLVRPQNLRGKGSVDGASAKAPSGMESLLGKFSDNNAKLGSKINSLAKPSEPTPLGGSPLGLGNVNPQEPGQEPAENERGQDIRNAKAEDAEGAVAPPLGQSSLSPQQSPQDQDEQNAPGQKENPSGENEKEDEDEEGQDEEQEEEGPPPIPQTAPATQGAQVASAADNALASKAVNEALKDFAPQVWAGLQIGKYLWKYKWVIAAGVFLGFTITLGIIMVAGCNFPIPAKYSKIIDYRTTYVGAFIGDDCKYFDISNFTTNSPNSTASASN